MMKKIDILVAYHKNYLTFKSNYLKPIQVGASNSELDLGFLKDNIGENISVKNNNYSELTAVYWAWKNLNSDYIGISHYRRYFILNNISTKIIKLKRKVKYHIEKLISLFRNRTGYNYNMTIKLTNKQVQQHINKFDLKIDSLLDQYDLILPEKTVFLNLNIKQQYEINHVRDDLEILENIIKEKKSSYMKSYKKIFKDNKISTYNMFIMRKNIFDEYCSWLFEILFELEGKVEISKNPYQARLFGFLSERLLNVYIDKLIEDNKIKIKYLPVAFLE
jgi:hypothetical protein